MRKMTMFGIGPRMAVVSLSWALLTGLISYRWPGLFLVRAVPRTVCLVVGILLLVAAAIIWALSGPAMKKAFDGERLVTTGPFGVVRNPIYAGVIFLALPAVAVICRSWLMLTTVPLAYAAFKWLIRAENAYLAEKFGQDYRDYCARVNEVFPWPRRRR